MNRLGVTGVIDAGGGFQNYPDDYAVIQRLADDNQMTVRLAYNLFTQKPKQEKEDFLNWTASVQYKQGTDYFRHNGAGEMLVFSAADFEDFRVERPDMPPEMEGELEEVVRVLAQNRWPWRLHATYDETIARALDVFEKVHRDTPLTGLNWFFDHAETISDKSIDRIAALGGGIAVQHRMAYQGEYFIERYGAAAAEATPPVAKMLARGVKVSAGTDATRVASYNPGCPCPGWSPARPSAARLYPARNCLDRETALRMWTENVAWFSNEEGKRGRIEPGQLADFIVPDKDYFSCAEDEISFLTSDLTVVGGRVVYGAGEFGPLDDNPLPPAMPDWSPTRLFGGYAAWGDPDGAGRNSLGYRNMAACGCAAPAACMATSMRAPGARRRPARTCRASSARWAAPAGPCEGAAMNTPSAWERRLAGAARPLFGSAAIRFLAYLGLCAAYLQGGLVKLTDFPGALREMAHFGLSPAPVYAVLVIALELIASAMILTGRLRWLGAAALALFTLAATGMALRFWELPVGQERFMAANAFFEHLGLAGGFRWWRGWI